MENAIASLTALIPAEVELIPMLKFVGLLAAAVLILALIARMLLGRHSDLNQALCSAIGILFIYALTIVVYTFNPADLAKHLAPLPFVTFKGDNLYLFSLAASSFPAICSELLSIVILAFIANLIDHFIPDGKSPVVWFLLRILTISIAFVIHIVSSLFLEATLSGVLVTYAPMILLSILLFMLFLGLLKGVLALVLSTVNPVIGAISAFFFGNFIGKQLRKAVMSAAMISGIVYALEHYGFLVISISSAALISYIPLIVALVLLWYFANHLF